MSKHTLDVKPAKISIESNPFRKSQTTASKPATAFNIQAKLTVGAADDVYEREADSVADKVVSMPSQPFVQRKCAACEKEEKETIHRKPLSASITPFIQMKSSEGASAVSPQLSQQIQSSRGSGNRMDESTSSFMSERFGSSFENVSIHTGSQAAQMNQHLNAKAFTIGNDIYFNDGQYQPNTSEGKHLLAHELTHAVQQTGNNVRRMPKDIHGRPLGFVETPEQLAYDQETYEIAEWNKVVERLAKGELDDRDLSNSRLRNRMTGLTTSEVNTLITSIKAWQAKNPALSTSKIIEWLEVRKEISTPMPDGASVSRDPITQTIDSYSFTANNVFVKVVADTFGNTGNDTGPTTNLGKSYNWKSNDKGIVTEVMNKDGGTDTPVNPMSLQVTIVTRYDDSPDGPSGYGKGTSEDDKREKTTTLRSHEGQHGRDYIDYIKSTTFPVDLSKGIVGVLTATQMKQLDAYISNITKASCELTDQVGFSQDEFIKTPAGKASGITSCRKP